MLPASGHDGHELPKVDEDFTLEVVWSGRLPPQAERERLEGIARLLLPSAPAGTTPHRLDEQASVLLQAYLPFPAWGRARLLLPVVTTAAASAALRLRRPPGRFGARQAAYQVAGQLLRRGLLQKVCRSRVNLRMRGVGEFALSQVTLADRVSELVGEPVHLAVRAGPPDPHRTVTMHALASSGRLVAFVKVTRSALSCEQLSTESRALGQASRGAGRVIDVPRPLYHGHWNGMGLLVITPMDLADGQQPTLDHPPSVEAMREVADTGLSSTAPLGQTPYWSQTRHRIDVLRTALPGSQVCRIASDLFEGLTSCASEVVLDLGGWHGDWLPWNLAWRDGRLLTWDWEYWSDCVPFGFDMLHFYAGTLFFRDGMDAGQALRVARARGGAVLEQAGFAPGVVDVVYALYVLEFLLRRLDIAVHGGGIDDARVFPSLLPVAFEALAQASSAVAAGGAQRQGGA